MNGGIFTLALAMIRAAWRLIERAVDSLSSLGGGLVYEIVSLLIIYGIIFFGLPIIELIIKLFKKLLEFWE